MGSPPQDTINFTHIHSALDRVSRGERASNSILSVPNLLRFWLWGSDANEVCENKCEFNQMYLAGILCTRIFQEAFETTPVIVDNEDIHHIIQTCDVFIPHFYQTSSVSTPDNTTDKRTPAPVCVPTHVTLQQLRDLVHALQTQWPRIQKKLDSYGNTEERLVLLERVEILTTQLFLWFGSYVFSTEIEEIDMDDEEFICAYPPSHKLCLSECGIRFYMSIFFILFRLLYIKRHAIHIPSKEDNRHPFEIEPFHLEAGIDDFHAMCMYKTLAPGNFIEYRSAHPTSLKFDQFDRDAPHISIPERPEPQLKILKQGQLQRVL